MKGCTLALDPRRYDPPWSAMAHHRHRHRHRHRAFMALDCCRHHGRGSEEKMGDCLEDTVEEEEEVEDQGDQVGN